MLLVVQDGIRPMREAIEEDAHGEEHFPIKDLRGILNQFFVDGGSSRTQRLVECFTGQL